MLMSLSVLPLDAFGQSGWNLIQVTHPEQAPTTVSSDPAGWTTTIVTHAPGNRENASYGNPSFNDDDGRGRNGSIPAAPPPPPLPVNGSPPPPAHPLPPSDPPPPMDTGPTDSSSIVMEDEDEGIDGRRKSKAERKRLREVLFLRRHPDQRIDYVIAYEDTDDVLKLAKRDSYRSNLLKEGIIIEDEYKKDSVDGKTNFMKLHVTWGTCCKIAELLYLPKKIHMPKSLEEQLAGCCQSCLSPFEVGDPIIPEEADYFTAEFDADNMQMFDIDMNDKDSFFTNSERSLICKEILDRTSYTTAGHETEKFGINRLVNEGAFRAAYPLHEGPFKPLPDDDEPFVGRDKDRSRLYEAWARPGRWIMHQPLDTVRKYFGEKVGIYFAWLGFYTTMLIPASVAGLVVFLYGCFTFYTYTPSVEMCDDQKMGSTVMCPECDEICRYWHLGDSCFYSRITFLFDNWATVIFACFMSLWATFFLEFWKRYQKTLEYDWDVADFEFEEPVRPEYEFTVKRKRKNPVTLEEEPHMGWYERLPRTCTSFAGVLVMMIVVLGTIFGVIIYRIITVFLFYKVEPNETFARLATSVTASVINFVAIICLNFIYTKIARALTALECPRTWTEYEDSYTFKMFLFQFVNYYGTIFYIAYFKGSFHTHPGDEDNYIFGKWKQDTCDPSGCLVDLFIQLATVMILKQWLNNAKELLLPKFLSWWRSKKSLKGETDENLYMRWEQDLDLVELPQLGLFDEYLEMVIQYGFVTIFVAAFPLAPLFALLNNVVEIRLDAYKFITVWRRSPALKAQDIGIWYSILQTISFLSIVTNAFIIGHTSDFVPKLVYIMRARDLSLDGYINSSLSYFAIADFTNNSRPTDPGINITDVEFCRYRGYYEHPYSDEKYEYTKEYWQIFTARLVFVLVFEHFVFVFTYMIAALVPDTPTSVKRLQIYERELVKKLRFDATFKDGEMSRRPSKKE